ncbi:FG-GAP repeat containing protein [Theileria orientalis strain Shintoku]|uniref:FG-GAP repeat containing protein n=1 Tax=Theileria orientalis strain Shintoku TaxID=869250 RepID=J7MH31_THEOR|nr:FG-GAP repeat containing protein [Theileria orientalis strain Shintoku]PVC49831.1 FG-GAP repeat containing protein [Theileria orientalis]BAM42501.1 FG-GAP repeat containing protein [Theileria orientalis strain Shintoku]|eukprot:XP_009692802.1 FG-GAP repeat containing protein [Theileria orientalis strain Shintoku]
MAEINTLLLLILLVVRTAISYNFKLESTQFRGRGYIGDFGDFDNTGRLNYATYSYNQNLHRSTIYIYYESASSNKVETNDEAADGREGTRFDGRNREFDVEGECDGLTASDLDSNGLLDLLLIMKENKQDKPEKSAQLYYLLAYFQNEEGRFINAWDSRMALELLFNKLDPIESSLRNLRPVTVPIGMYELTSIHPLVADFDGDGYSDIMVQTKTNKVYFWINYGKVFLPFYMESVPSITFIGSVEGVIPNPHSCSFIDMNGDCRPDLVLTSERVQGPHVEIWVCMVSEERITYNRIDTTIPLPYHYGMITFNDFDSDGTNDLMIPFCYTVDDEGFCGDGLKLAIVYNKQMPFCPQMIRSSEEQCRHPDNLCINSPMVFTPYRDKVIAIGIKYQYLYPLKTSMKLLFRTGDQGKPITQLARVSACDFNNNSLIDLILPLSTIDPTDGSKRYLVMVIKDVDKGHEITTLELKDQGLVPTHATAADIMDRRMLNLLVFATNGKTLNCFYYSLYKENVDLFMKVMTKYKNIEESKYPDSYFLSGSNNNGLTYKLTVIDIHGIKNVRTATLRPQTAYTPLYTPFTYIGLGKTNNYVEELYLGVASSNKNYFHMWISIIPSCTVITLPIPLHNPTQWILKLSIIPGKKLFTILLSTSLTLIVLGIVILIFDFREKREDYVRAKGFRQKFIIN